ncbi:PAS domain-containing protein [Streptomyces sp. NPDC005181]|uniref:PAS domain-containing protein n=1 Tax=Streptomyces sp. NPDC005181 TaxID=3156869 RepID=UPI00339F0A4E
MAGMGAPTRTRSTAADAPLGPWTAVVVVDGAGVVRGWNEGATKLIGHSAPEVLGRPLSDVFLPVEGAAYQAGTPDLAARLGSQQGWEGLQAVRRSTATVSTWRSRSCPSRTPATAQCA